MKILTTFHDSTIVYTKPITLPHCELASNCFCQIDFSGTDTSPIDIYSLPDFYQITLPEKKMIIKDFFNLGDFDFSKIILDLPYFNTITLEKPLAKEIIFDVECALFQFIKYPFPENLIIHTNSFGMNNFTEAKCVKIKISPDKDTQKNLASILNEQAKKISMPLLRFDGNQKFELSDLIFFLNLLDEKVLNAIEYIEEPFKNFYDIYLFQKLYNIKIGIDESLLYFLDKLDKLPKNTPIILKPALYGISKSFELIKKASLLGHPVIISSTYQPASTFPPLLALANYSDKLNKFPLFHGLDTLNFMPPQYQNSRILNSLSIA